MSINSGEFPNLLQNDKLLVRMPKMTSVKHELQVALRYLTDHSLTHSAKWYHLFSHRVGQLLLGVTTQADIDESFLTKSFIHSNTDYQKEYHVRVQDRETEIESVLLLAKNLFELREYKKCSHILKDYRAQFPHNQSLIFYYCYSLWMSGLIRK